MHNSIADLEARMKSLMLMNEDILVKLQISSQKEIEHSNLIKALVEEKSSKTEDKELLDTIKELKNNMDDLMAKYNNIEKRMQALDPEKYPIRKDEILKIENPKVLIKYQLNLIK